MAYYSMQVVYINRRTHLLLSGSSWISKEECYEVYHEIESLKGKPDELIILEVIDPDGMIISMKYIERKVAEKLLLIDDYDLDLAIKQATKFKRYAKYNQERLVMLSQLD